MGMGWQLALLVGREDHRGELSCATVSDRIFLLASVVQDNNMSLPSKKPIANPRPSGLDKFVKVTD